MMAKKNMFNIFDLIVKYENNKEGFYNQYNRNLTFNVDSDWIKHAFTPKSNLNQINL